MIDFSYTNQQKELYNDVVSFAKKNLNEGIIERDKQQQFSYEGWKKCGSKKMQGLCVSKKYDGAGLNAIDAVIALEALGCASSDGGLNFSIAAHLLACVIPIYLYGNEELKEKYLPDLCNGNLIAANAITERESGSDVFSMNTQAVKVNSQYKITGEKTFISNAPIADVILLYALTNKNKGFHGGISAFLIDGKAKGIDKSAPFNKMGLRTGLMGQLNFTEVEVSEKALVGKEGAGSVIFIESMNWERALLSALHVGTMKRVIENLVQYANKVDIGKNQWVAHKIAEMKVLEQSSRLMVYKSATDLAHKSIETTFSAASTKLFVSESLNTVCQIAQNIYGESGYLIDNEIERMVRDALAAKIYSGTSEIQKNIIASQSGLIN